MLPDDLLQTKLVPPRPQRYTLIRPRLLALLREALEYRVTILQASTGYGKSTALAQLADTGIPLFWYTVSESDVDPQQFLAHLIAAFQIRLPTFGDTPLAMLNDGHANSFPLAANALLNAVNPLVSRPSLLVIDDYHLVGNGSATGSASSASVNALTDYLLGFLPRDLHAIISTRYPPEWEHLTLWRARSQVLDIKRDALAFTPDEIEQLFREKFGLPLSPTDRDVLAKRTEGWSIALQLVWQQLRDRPGSDLHHLLSRAGSTGGSLETLFDYLAQEVLERQPRDAQEFMLQTAILRELDDNTCAALVGESSRGMLAQLIERDLFLIPIGNGNYRYHHLFRDFLRNHAGHRGTLALQMRHLNAANYYRESGNPEEAIYHLLRAEAFTDAGDLIQEVGENTLRAGRLETLAGWLDALPSELMNTRPLLLFIHGELARLRSRFDEAGKSYADAGRLWRIANDKPGIVRALRGQALAYLDRLQMPEADKLLYEALKLTDGIEDREIRARLLETLSETKLNLGRTDEAESLRRQAALLRDDLPGEDTISIRVKLRTGRLDQAREVLEVWAREERGKPRSSRGHRETLLLLSLIHSAQGQADDAFTSAQQAIVLGTELESPSVCIVGQLRLGHAHQLLGDLPAALKCYESGIAQGDLLDIPSVRVEARWGMARVHGLMGDLVAAQNDAVEGIKIGRQFGDLWMVSQVQLALGASLVTAHYDKDGSETLVDALVGFHACGDKFGSAAAWMWLALAQWHCGDRERALAHLTEALELAQGSHYDYLLTSRTLLGWQDPCTAVPMLIAARDQSEPGPRERTMHVYAGQLLQAMGLTDVQHHPGYQVRMQTLGPFRLWRNGIEVPKQEWQRKKARQLLQFLVTQRGRMLDREEIFEMLWRDESPVAAMRDFKVALNALNRVLEPGRPADAPPAFITRDESAYGLSTAADVWIDAEEFSHLVARAEVCQETDDTALELYRRALALYHDDYLKMDAPYEDWAIARREHLQTLYLRAADHLASGLLERHDDAARSEAEKWCKDILARDRCWEHAYRLLIQLYGSRGDPVEARRTFDECVRILHADLGVAPSSATVQTLNQVVDNR